MLEYAQRIESKHPLRLRPWVEAYLQSVFDEDFDKGALDQALQSRLEFLASLRRCFPPLRRILGFLNPVGSANSVNPFNPVGSASSGNSSSRKS